MRQGGPSVYKTIEVLRTRRQRIVWMTERYGMTADEIARELNLCCRTVQRHRVAHRQGIAPKHPGPQTCKGIKSSI